MKRAHLARTMKLKLACDLEYQALFPSTLILNIHAQHNAAQTILEEQLSIEPRLRSEALTPTGSENRFIRIETGRAKQLRIRYRATVDCNYDLLAKEKLHTTPIAQIDSDALQYLFPSRYCQSDRLSRLAWDLFGKIKHPYDRVLAIVDWIHDNVEYVRGSTDSQTSAYDTVTQRTGVCRDFAHLGIALCRALNIPARYFSGYAYQLEPPDMHACFECYIEHRWLVFDATRLAHLNALVRVGTGRDAADAAVASIFGAAQCKAMKVSCELVKGERFKPLNETQLRKRGVALESATGA
jgi:transglutaminase-like putative cysteine protease